MLAHLIEVVNFQDRTVRKLLTAHINSPPKQVNPTWPSLHTPHRARPNPTAIVAVLSDLVKPPRHVGRLTRCTGRRTSATSSALGYTDTARCIELANMFVKYDSKLDSLRVQRPSQPSATPCKQPCS
jgi:hypothetical protein